MTREQMKERLPIFKAYAEGKPIEYKEKGKEEWRKIRDDADRFNFDFAHYDYRVMAYRPFKDAQECWEEMQKHHPFGWVSKGTKLYAIKAVECNTVFIDDGCENRSLLAYFSDGFTFADGTPFGKLKE